MLNLSGLVHMQGFLKKYRGASFKNADDELLNVQYQGWLEKKMAEFDDLKNVNKADSSFS